MKRKLREKPDYNSCHFSKGELILIFAKGVVFLAVISYLFYHSCIAFFCLSPLLALYIQREKNRKKKFRLKRLNMQFKDGIQILLSGLEAGYSIENAFVESCQELQQMYLEKDDIVREFRSIISGIRMNETLEALLFDFAERSGLEDVKSFAEVFSIAKRKGGDLVAIIRSCVQTIQEKAEVEAEIETMIAGKKLEQNIMNIVPIGIMLYVNLTSADFLSVLYGNLAGIVMMSGCLCLYGAAFYIGNRIVEVEI